MRRTWEKLWKTIIAFVLCVTMLMSNAVAFEATERLRDAICQEVIEEDTENKDTNKPNNTKPDEEEKDGIPGYVWLILVVVLVVAGAAGVIWYRKNNESVSEE